MWVRRIDLGIARHGQRLRFSRACDVPEPRALHPAAAEYLKVRAQEKLRADG